MQFGGYLKEASFARMKNKGKGSRIKDEEPTQKVREVRQSQSANPTFLSISLH
jgi:hypothetical protein